jgi:uncharacterized membrane protein YbhN (UPF0104 family)
MKHKFKILLYSSLAFLAVFLYRNGFLTVPKIYNPIFLVFSFLFLFCGMLLQSVNWKGGLKAIGVHIGFKDALVSTGLSIFMKYIPGKVMVILGRAKYISDIYGVRVSKTSAASFVAQIITLITGAFLGGVIFFEGSIDGSWAVFTAFSMLFLVLILVFFNFFRRCMYWLSRFFNKKIILPKVKSIKLLNIVPSFFLTWLCFAIGFWLLASSLFLEVKILVGLVFPLAAVLGIVSIIAPGGLGVREGALTICLTAMGLSLEEATTLAVFSRVWFLVGEVFMFVSAVLVNQLLKS